MSALLNPSAGAPPTPRRLTPMTAADVDAVMAIETHVYPFPWTRGNFIDSLAAGYVAQLLRDAVDDQLIGYFVALAGVQEMHLLNFTVAPSHQGRGHARFMMDDLVERSRRAGADHLWLEVRESNATALAIYRHFGFVEQGRRPGYYPAAQGKRERAVIMSLALTGVAGSGHALD